jgi:hypothetical protein
MMKILLRHILPCFEAGLSIYPLLLKIQLEFLILEWNLVIEYIAEF